MLLIAVLIDIDMGQPVGTKDVSLLKEKKTKYSALKVMANYGNCN